MFECEPAAEAREEWRRVAGAGGRDGGAARADLRHTRDVAATVFHAATAYQVPAGVLKAIEETLAGTSRVRPIWRV